MKRLLFVIHALNSAGAQRVLVDMVNKIDLEKYDITVQTIFTRDGLAHQIDPRVHIKSLIRTRNPVADALLRYLVRRVLSIRWVYDCFIKDDYDFEIAYLEGEPARLIAHSTNRKARKYAWVHTDMMRNFTSQGLYKTVAEHADVYRQFDRIICVSQGVKEAFIQRFGFDDNVIVKYNISDDAAVNRKALEEAADFAETDVLKLVMVSGLRKEKRHCLLLNVLKRLKDEGYEFFLHIVGDGSERIRIEETVSMLKLEACVKLVGMKENPYPYMKKSDLLIISSAAEGYSTVAVEACLLGVPVLATDCAGTNEVLENGRYGMIVPNSEEGLYAGLKEILNNRKMLAEYRELLARSDHFSMAEKIREIECLFAEE